MISLIFFLYEICVKTTKNGNDLSNVLGVADRGILRLVEISTVKIDLLVCSFRRLHCSKAGAVLIISLIVTSPLATVRFVRQRVPSARYVKNGAMLTVAYAPVRSASGTRQ